MYKLFLRKVEKSNNATEINIHKYYKLKKKTFVFFNEYFSIMASVMFVDLAFSRKKRTVLYTDKLSISRV